MRLVGKNAVKTGRERATIAPLRAVAAFHIFIIRTSLGFFPPLCYFYSSTLFLPFISATSFTPTLFLSSRPSSAIITKANRPQINMDGQEARQGHAGSQSNVRQRRVRLILHSAPSPDPIIPHLPNAIALHGNSRFPGFLDASVITHQPSAAAMAIDQNIDLKHTSIVVETPTGLVATSPIRELIVNILLKSANDTVFSSAVTTFKEQSTNPWKICEACVPTQTSGALRQVPAIRSDQNGQGIVSSRLDRSFNNRVFVRNEESIEEVVTAIRALRGLCDDPRIWYLLQLTYLQ